MNTKKTLVIGASLNENRYSNMAIRSLRAKQYPVVAYGLKKGKVLDVDIETERIDFKDIDTVSMYVNPQRQVDLYDYILSLNPRRIIFNPGTENSEFEQKAKEKGIEVYEYCTLVLLSTGQF